MTFVSTAHAVVYSRGTPIFADVDERTLSLDLDDVARKITPRTKAIVVVHYAGRPVDMDTLRQIAGNIPIIGDAAHACGASYKGRSCGTLADIACFSFQAVKNLATGDGGALALKDKAMADRAKRLRWMGIDKGTWDRTENDHRYLWDYSVDEIGLKCHMNDIMAALGLVQLRRLDGANARRKEIASAYTKGLRDLTWLQLPPEDDADYQSSWHIYCVQSDYRDDLMEFLQQKDISTGVHYRPIHMYKCYGRQPRLPKAEKAFTRILSLPMHPGLSDDDVNHVVESIRSFSYRVPAMRKERHETVSAIAD